jgi:acyl-coenzyme A thioesterase PaaI-like protein
MWAWVDIVTGPMSGFDDDIALEPTGERSWAGAIAAGWDTPRGPLGGYVMAILMRGFELAINDPARTARAVTVHFLRSPGAGPVAVSAVVEREGRSLSTLSGRLEQDGKLIALGLGAYSTAWESPLLDHPPMPQVEPADPDHRPPPDPDRDLPAGDFPRKNPPPFTQRLSMQHRFGEPPFSGAERGEVGGWLGLRERRPLDAPAIAMLADAWFPAPWPRLAELAPAPTIDLTVHFRTPLPLPDTLLLGRFSSSLVRDGFFDEDGELWTPDGTLVAHSRQLGLLLGATV